METGVLNVCEKQPQNYTILEENSPVGKSLGDGGGVRCNSWPQIGAFLGHGSSDGAALHFSFVVNDHARVVLEVQRNAILSVIRLPLSNHHRWDNLFPELRLSLLH